MSKCDYCGSFIIGGVKDGDRRFCNSSCKRNGYRILRDSNLTDDVTSPNLDSRGDSIWEVESRKLKVWYYVYIGCWVGGILMLIINNGLLILFFAFSALVTYIVCISYACKVQTALKVYGLGKAGSGQIIIAALILNPLIVGFYVPLSVLLAVRRVRKRQKLN
jgi:hypothetical protein